jgi:hypothetical protein
MNSQNASEDRIMQLASLLRDHLNACQNQFPTGLAIQPGTPAARDLAAPMSGPGGPWTSDTFMTYLGLAHLRLDLARDHLFGLAKLLEPPLTMYAWASVARQGIEAAGRAFWLLDPKLDLHDRIYRSLIEQMDNVNEEVALHELIVSDDKDNELIPKVVDKLRRQDELRQQAIALGVPAPILNRDGKIKGRPSATTVAHEILTGVTNRPNYGKTVYKALSGASHGAIYAMVTRYHDVGPADDSGSRKVRRQVPLSVVEGTVEVALLAHFAAVDRAVDYCGCEVPGFWSAWQDVIGRRIWAYLSSPR